MQEVVEIYFTPDAFGKIKLLHACIFTGFPGNFCYAGRAAFAAKDAIVQMFTPKPPFDLAAFLAEKADPLQVKKYQQSRRWRMAPKARPAETADGTAEEPV
ncbi:hypothetical protein ACFOHK_00335 [Falsigemmobacter intermedius]|uniref:Uncharacterized protein n=1 Tax=Falsigemmobacter intermedius TaxID=1553448 RepID=A0A3S3U4Z2_9RHOB|nr:hypothetical protein [Falsigemmobacter intermedius]RWY34349.1 hypothetical protein EP867_19380 [Falsigemmobacter intermedius]